MFGKRIERVSVLSINGKICLSLAHISKGERIVNIEDSNVKTFILEKDTHLLPKNLGDAKKDRTKEFKSMLKKAYKCKHESLVFEKEELRFEQVREVTYCEACSLAIKVKTIKTKATQMLKEIKRLVNETNKEEMEIKRRQKQIEQGIKKIQSNRALIGQLSSSIEENKKSVE